MNRADVERGAVDFVDAIGAVDEAGVFVDARSAETGAALDADSRAVASAITDSAVHDLADTLFTAEVLIVSMVPSRWATVPPSCGGYAERFVPR